MPSPYKCNNRPNRERHIKAGPPPPDDSFMRHRINAAALAGLLRDDRGGEVIEWALVAGLIVIATIAVIGAVGTNVLARWNTVNEGL